jgi:DNA-binding CsgD family transcriptional regulator
MGPWKRLLIRLGFKRGEGPHYYELDEPLEAMLESIAVQEKRSPGEVQADLIEAGLAQLHTRAGLQKRWQALSAREQQVVALTCLGYTNAQIGAILHISTETVKTHMRTGLLKFNLHGKAELRQVLDGWDFSGWEK